MKLLLACLLITFMAVTNAVAQTDTIIHYYNAEWKECARDTAKYISRIFALGNQWQRKDYWLTGMKLQSEENWLDAKATRPTGTSTWYNDSGMITKKQIYENEKAAKTFYFFDNGNKKAIVSYDAEGNITKQTGWEKDGTEIKDYVYEMEAYFPGGKQAWMAYLLGRINPNTAAKAKAKKGIYTVKVQFIINKEGKVEHAQTISVPPECPKCGEEAIRIINGSPAWEHAIQYGHAVIYQAIQAISWQVED